MNQTRFSKTRGHTTVELTVTGPDDAINEALKQFIKKLIDHRMEDLIPSPSEPKKPCGCSGS